MTTLALYTPHNSLWFLPVILAGVLLFGISTVLGKKKVLLMPRWLPYVFWGIGAGGIAGMIGLKNYDSMKLREELRAVNSSEATHVMVVKGAERREVADRAAAAKIVSILGNVKSVAAHHSHPQDSVEVLFDFGGESWHYRVGRDSDIPTEYWVFNLNPACTRFGEMEFGRLQTAEWEAAMAAVLTPSAK